jgi:hypothetical protein
MQLPRFPVALFAGLLLSIGAAQAQSTGTVTATCKDGTSFTGAKRSGACHGHGGVQSWGAAAESGGLVTPAIEPASRPASTKSPAQAQSTVTATCKDGTSFTGAKRSGACHGHGGVQSWGTATEPTTIPVNAPAEPATPVPTTSRRAAAPPPAGNGQVWVNTDSRVYHCPGTRWYGKTNQGTYMSEAQAQAQGAKPDHGKACAS